MGSWPPSRLTRIGRILTAYGGVFVVGSLAWAWPSTASDPTATT
jgi:drug/metabolite transporter superfamily protein YnfA